MKRRHTESRRGRRGHKWFPDGLAQREGQLRFFVAAMRDRLKRKMGRK